MIDQQHSKQFDKLYDLTYDDVLKFVVCHCSNINDVNDIMQETYLELYKILNRKELNQDNIKSFIKGIANNKLKKHYSILYKLQTISLFSKNINDIELIDTITDNIDIEKIVINDELSNKIWEFIKDKKLIISKIFFLHYYSNLTIKEISKHLNVSESYIKNCLYRTLKDLQNTFGKDSD